MSAASTLGWLMQSPKAPVYEQDYDCSLGRYQSSMDPTGVQRSGGGVPPMGVPAPPSSQGDMGDNDPGKMFVGGISWNTNEDTLKKYFTAFGPISECCVMQDPVTKRSRGFGFIKFSHANVVDKVLTHPQPHIVDGKKVDPKRAVPKNQNKLMNRTKKVFLGGLPPDTSEDDVKAYFRQYGEIEEVMLMYDKTTQRLRGFGFVKFTKEDSADDACREHYHEVKGKMIEAKKAQPKEAMSLSGMAQRTHADQLPYQIYNRTSTSLLGYNPALALNYNAAAAAALASLQQVNPMAQYYAALCNAGAKKTPFLAIEPPKTASMSTVTSPKLSPITGGADYTTQLLQSQQLALALAASQNSIQGGIASGGITPGLLDFYTTKSMSMAGAQPMNAQSLNDHFSLLAGNHLSSPPLAATTPQHAFFTTDTTQLLAAFNGYQ